MGFIVGGIYMFLLFLFLGFFIRSWFLESMEDLVFSDLFIFSGWYLIIVLKWMVDELLMEEYKINKWKLIKLLELLSGCVLGFIYSLLR